MDIQPAAEPIDLTPADDLTPEPVGAEDTGSLDEHEAQFKARSVIEKPEPVADEPVGLTKDEQAAVDKTGKFARYRAQSQKATPEDVAEINALTKELRGLEGELVKAKPDAVGTESPRVKVLKRQIAAVKADLESAKPKDSTPPPAAMPRTATATEFKDEEPQPDAYTNEADPLGAYMKAWNRWDRKRERFEETQATQQAEASQAEERVVVAAKDRIEKFKADHADFDAKTSALMSVHLPAVLLNAVVRHDKSAEVMYHLAQRPDLIDELVLLTDGKQISDTSVAAVQRRLTTLLGTQAAPTGSAPPTRPFNPPRPPNPVRTGPNRSGDELPGEDASLAEHERAFTHKRKR